MSKFVKDLQTRHVKTEMTGVSDLVVVNVIGLNSGESAQLRTELRKKGIKLRVVRNTLARRAMESLGLGGAGNLLNGASAVAWGGEGIVELAKEITEWAKKLKKLEVKGAFVSGASVDAKGVQALSTMPSRPELLAKIAGQILAPGANLAAALLGPGGTLAGQIKSIGEEKPAAEG